jgi:hypothetical protein
MAFRPEPWMTVTLTFCGVLKGLYISTHAHDFIIRTTD